MTNLFVPNRVMKRSDIRLENRQHLQDTTDSLKPDLVVCAPFQQPGKQSPPQGNNAPLHFFVAGHESHQELNEPHHYIYLTFTQWCDLWSDEARLIWWGSCVMKKERNEEKKVSTYRGSYSPVALEEGQESSAELSLTSTS